MPIREYVCQACGETLERLQRLSEEPLTDCPSCGKSALEKKISAVAFRLSGSGWYETDFKSDNRRNVSPENGSSDESASEQSSAKDEKNSSETTGQDASGKSDERAKGSESGQSKESTSSSKESPAKPGDGKQGSSGAGSQKSAKPGSGGEST